MNSFADLWNRIVPEVVFDDCREVEVVNNLGFCAHVVLGVLCSFFQTRRRKHGNKPPSMKASI